MKDNWDGVTPEIGRLIEAAWKIPEWPMDVCWRVVTGEKPYIYHYINEQHSLTVHWTGGDYAIGLWKKHPASHVVRSWREKLPKDAAKRAYAVISETTNRAIIENMTKETADSLVYAVFAQGVNDYVRLYDKPGSANELAEIEKFFTSMNRSGLIEYARTRWHELQDEKERKMGEYTFDRYAEEAARTCDPKLSGKDRTRHAVFEITSEAGEIAGIFQKQYQGHKVDDEHLMLEIGDVLWGLNELCMARGFRLRDCAMMDILKLKDRDPDGFDQNRSLHRKEGDL